MIHNHRNYNEPSELVVYICRVIGNGIITMSEIMSINAIQLRVATKLSLSAKNKGRDWVESPRTTATPQSSFLEQRARILKDAEEVEEIRFTSTGGLMTASAARSNEIRMRSNFEQEDVHFHK